MDLQLYLIPSRNPPAALKHTYNASYGLWESVWLKTLGELDGLKVLSSDGFTTQEFFAVIHSQGSPMALCCYKTLNLSIPCHHKDSWLAPWPKEILAEISQTYSRALIPSWLTVHDDFRKSAGYQGANLALILSELISVICLHTKASIAFGTPRVDRSVNKLVYQAGATCLLSDVIHHGVPVDLVAFIPEKLRTVEFTSETTRLWNQRIDFTQPETPKENTHERHL